jgi:hypothetical protein
LQTTAEEVSRTRSVQHWTSGNDITLTREQLLPFSIKNGKISVGRAIAALGHAFVTIRRECEKHGLLISHAALKEAICLETLAQLLGGMSYETEWNDGTFLNPKTGGRFRFDGFFRERRLLVEFHGSQHYNPTSKWFFDGGGTYAELVERDQEKARQVQADGRFRLFAVREDEPYADPTYLRGRLMDEGLFDPGA